MQDASLEIISKAYESKKLSDHYFDYRDLWREYNSKADAYLNCYAFITGKKYAISQAKSKRNIP